MGENPVGRGPPGELQASWVAMKLWIFIPPNWCYFIGFDPSARIKAAGPSFPGNHQENEFRKVYNWPVIFSAQMTSGCLSSWGLQTTFPAPNINKQINIYSPSITTIHRIHSLKYHNPLHHILEDDPHPWLPSLTRRFLGTVLRGW